MDAIGVGPDAHCRCRVPQSAHRRNMFRSVLITILLGATSTAGAQALTFADVKARNATQLTADELRELVPRANIVSRTAQGSTRRWQNKPDGTFTASAEGRGSSGGRKNYATGAGTLRVRDNGTLCVT